MKDGERNEKDVEAKVRNRMTEEKDVIEKE